MNTVKNFTTIHLQLDRCVGSCNSLNSLPDKVCVPNKAVDLNLIIFNMITGINERETLTTHILWECKYRFDETKCQCEWKKHHISKKRKKILFGILLLVVVKMENI